MIAPARALRKFATRIGQFGAHGCTAVELDATGHTMIARVKARGVEATLTMPCDTTDGDLSPVSIAPARFFAGVTIADGDVRIANVGKTLALTYDGGDVGLFPSGAVDPAKYAVPEMIMVAPEDMRAADAARGAT